MKKFVETETCREMLVVFDHVHNWTWNDNVELLMKYCDMRDEDRDLEVTFKYDESLNDELRSYLEPYRKQGFNYSPDDMYSVIRFCKDGMNMYNPITGWFSENYDFEFVF